MERNDGKFLLLTPEYHPDKGGVSEYLYGVVEKFPGEVQVVRGPFFWKSVWPRWLCGVWTSWKIVKKEKPDLIWISHVLPMGYIALAMRVITGTQYVIFTHGLDVSIPHEKKWKFWWMRYILKHAVLVVANSKFTASILEQNGVNHEAIHILYPCGQLFEEQANSVYLERAHKEASILIKKFRNKKIILSVGRLINRKGQLRAVRALSHFLKENPDTQYVIIGDGPEREEIAQYIKNEKLKESVTLLRDVHNNELPLWYQSATLFLLPTVSLAPDVEGFGLVFVEAGRYGIPVIGGLGGGVEEAVQDSVSGILIDGSSEMEIQNAVKKLLSDGVMRRRMGEQGKLRSNEFFNIADQVLSFAKRVYSVLPAPSFEPNKEDEIRQALVSVIIPAYNHLAELQRTLESLNAQTYSSLEIVVVDDGSTDGTEEALKTEYLRWRGRRSFSYTKISHSGAPVARNEGVKKARGALIIFWDADIIAKPHMIERMAQTLRNNPSAAFVYSSFYFGWKKFVCGEFDPERLKEMNYITTTSLIRREYFPGFDESLTRFQDWDLWLTIVKRGGIGVWIPEFLFRVILRRKGLGISSWLPSFMYKAPLFKNWQVVREYHEARLRIVKKHHLL